MSKSLQVFKDLPAISQERFIQFLEDEVRGRSDIVYFSEKLLGIKLNPFQAKYLKTSTTPRAKYLEEIGREDADISGLLFGKTITPCANQVGKTVAIAIKHIWFAKYKIGMNLTAELIDTAFYSTLNISPHTRQVRACFRYIKEILDGEFIIDEEGTKHLNELHPLMKEFLVGNNANLGELRYANKSITYTVPVGQDQASSLAGAQFALITYDECAQSHHLKDELGAKILSRLIKYGVALDLISTPEVDAPSHQYYLHLSKLGRLFKEGWISISGVLDDNIFIPQKQRDMIKADLLATDKKRFLQVTKGEFISGGARFFDANEIENLWTLSGKKDMQRGRKYLLVADWGMADSGDPSVFGVFDRTNYPFGPTGMPGKIDLVNHESIQGGTPNMQFALLRTLYDQYTIPGEDGVSQVRPEFIMDSNSLGGVVIQKLLADLKPKPFKIIKDNALLITRKAMGERRQFIVSDEGLPIEQNPDYGDVRSYFIEDLGDELGIYQLKDDKLKTDFVMMFVMGISYIVKKYGRKPQKRANINRFVNHNTGATRLPEGVLRR